MSVFKKCPYSNEGCYFENFSLSIGIPRFNNCKTCTIHRCIIDDDDDLKEDEVKETLITKHKSDSEVIAELKKEVEDEGVKYADSLEYTISKFSDEEGYCWSQVEQAYEKGALDFAEPREKRITELEKKNTDLKKENTELKEKLGDVQMQKAGEKSDLVWKLKKANEQKSEQLTKAKEIIRKYYNYNPSREYSYDDIDKQAELFLKGYKESD